MVFAKAATRVNEHSRPEHNARIARETRARIEVLRARGPVAIHERLEQLDREWDIERVLEAQASSLVVLGTLLGKTVHRGFFALPAIVGAFLLQHALHGWCPPVPLFRALGVRTPREIEDERHELLRIQREFARG